VVNIIDDTCANLPYHRSHSCASSDSLLFPQKYFSWGLLLEPCRLLTGPLWALWGYCGQFRRSLWRILLHISGESTSKANEIDNLRSIKILKHASYQKRDLGSVLTDVFMNKTPQTKKGGFKAAWRMKFEG